MVEKLAGDYSSRLWVFGGYLSNKQPEFIAPRTKEELEQYLYSAQFYILNSFFKEIIL